jgi:4-amino-4-deoxy-L-arabinose transferase-like glycosyltransferase
MIRRIQAGFSTLANAEPLRRYLFLFALDFLLRIPVILLVAADPARAVPMGDPPGYYRLAVNLSEQGIYSQGTAEPYLPDTDRTPGYPLFLAAIFAVAGQSVVAAAVAQSLLHGLSGLLVARLGESLFGSPRIGAAGALLWAVAPIPAIFCGILLTETLFTPVFLLTLLLLTECSPRRSLLAGGALGLGILIRPIASLVWPALLPAFFPGTGWRRALANFAVFCAAAAAVLAPWLIRNNAVFGKPVLSSVQGVNILYNTISGYIAWRDGLTLTEARSETERLYAEYLAENGIHPSNRVETSDAESALAMKILLADPVRVLWFNGVDSLNGFRPGASYMVVFLSPNTLAPDDVSGGELSPAVANMARPEILLTMILLSGFYVALFLLAAAEIYSLLRRKKWRVLLLFGLPAAVLIYLPGISSNARFRIPVEPLICLLAAAALVEIPPLLAARLGRTPHPEG